MKNAMEDAILCNARINTIEASDMYLFIDKAFQDNYLGIAESAGCVRLLSGDAKWVYDNCALGTTVTIYNSPKPGPYDRPAIEWVIPGDQHWDPTDPLFAQQQ